MIKRTQIIDAFFILILAALTISFYKIMAIFILDIFLALIFFNIFRPLFISLQTGFTRKGKKPKERKVLSSLVTIMIVFLIIAVPLSIITTLAAREISSGYQSIAEQIPLLNKPLETYGLYNQIKNLPLIGEQIREYGSLSLENIAAGSFKTISGFIFETAQKSFVSIAGTALHFIVILFLMFFLFIDGGKLYRRVRSLLPMDPDNTDQMARETIRITSATLISTMIIGLIEGAYGAVIFLIFGIPSPIFWGVIILILSMIPLIGANMIIVPAGILYLIGGHYLGGFVIILLGIGGVAVTQNIIKPKLLGDRSGLHPALVLLSTIGGIAWLGIIGFLIGPLVASLFVISWEQFGKRYINNS
jgi:predicted PurR-regulated permease PerM